MDASSPAVTIVFGAGGAIGGALARRVAAQGDSVVLAGARRALKAEAGLHPFIFDLEDEDSLARAAEIASQMGVVRRVIIATGLLHAEGVNPEKSLRSQSAEAYQKLFAVNAQGPALIGKHFIPRLARRGRVEFAALSAKVGSIEDNRLGGWHAYRASKAALNMILKTFAIELSRINPESVVAALHPGTVRSALSAPFARDPERLIEPDEAAERLLRVLGAIEAWQSGCLWSWNGERLPF